VAWPRALELGTHLRPSEVHRAAVPRFRVGSLTGPTNALAVARGDPSAMVLATAESGDATPDLQAADQRADFASLHEATI